MPSLPVAEDWFAREEAGDGVTRLWEQHVTPFLQCNIWYLRGRDSDLLIDTGLGLGSLRAALGERAGRRLQVVLTHAHLDHMGGAYEFEDRQIHAIEAPELDHPQAGLSLDLAAWSPRTRTWVEGMGYDVSGGLLTSLPHAGYDVAGFALRPAPATQLLHEGDRVDLGDRSFEVLHLPGHSPGGIGLWDADSGVLFSGDAIYDGPLLDELPGSDVTDYVKTMRRLRELPVEVVHAGHDPSFGRARLIELADAYLARRA